MLMQRDDGLDIISIVLRKFGLIFLSISEYELEPTAGVEMLNVIIWLSNVLRYEKCLVGLNSILKEAWREKTKALSLAKESYTMKLELLAILCY